MKLSNATKVMLLTTISFLILKAFSKRKNKKWDKKIRMRTPFSCIKDYNDALDTRLKCYPITIQTRFPIDLARIDKIRQATKCRYFLAVFGFQKAIFSVSIIGSNEKGNDVSPIYRPADYPQIRWDYMALINELKKAGGKIPLNLNDFPLVIKMDADEIIDIIKETKCKNLLGYLGIESQSGVEKLTISILGSDASGINPHPGHLDGTIDGSETWPLKNFTFFKTWKSTDIVLPN